MASIQMVPKQGALRRESESLDRPQAARRGNYSYALASFCLAPC